MSALAKAHAPQMQVNKLTEGAYLLCTTQGNILFGCPPEILKRILASHLPMPDTIVLPRKLQHYHSSQASLEFPLYHFLFVQRGLDRGRRFQVIAASDQCDGLAELLRVTVTGPSEAEMVSAGAPKAVAHELAQETRHMSLKHPETRQPYKVREMINFVALDPGGSHEVYEAGGKAPAVALERTGEAEFRVTCGKEEHILDMAVSAEQTPNYDVTYAPFDRRPGRFTVNVLGRSNGFDPADPANGYVINVDGRIVLWDCPAYLHQHLKAMGLEAKDIEAFVLSHVHEDHLDPTESLRDPPFELYATPEVYHSLLVKVSGVLGCSLEEAKRHYHWHPIDIDAQPQELAGARFHFFHAVHAIPAIGVRIEKDVNGRRGLLHISGDHLSKAALSTMLEHKGISKRRYEQVNGLLDGSETLVLMDVGGGAIHGDYREYLDYEGRIGFMHTGLINEELPSGKWLIRSGEVLDVLEPAD